MGQAWRKRAACRGTDPNLWFSHDLGEVERAKDICAGCPVRAACFLEALENSEEYGIWGGTTEAQRRAMHKARGEQGVGA